MVLPITQQAHGIQDHQDAAELVGEGAAAALASPRPNSFSPASFMNDINPMLFSCFGANT
jgi:hypothetical protein